VKAGHLEAAWEFSQCARAAAERTDDAGQIRIARKVQAGVLARLGRCREALAVMPVEEDAVFVCRVEDTVHWAELLLVLGERAEAHQWVARAYDLMAAGQYPYWRQRADALAGQL
jgi:hypothetical protein